MDSGILPAHLVLAAFLSSWRRRHSAEIQLTDARVKAIRVRSLARRARQKRPTLFLKRSADQKIVTRRNGSHAPPGMRGKKATGGKSRAALKNPRAHVSLSRINDSKEKINKMSVAKKVETHNRAEKDAAGVNCDASYDRQSRANVTSMRFFCFSRLTCFVDFRARQRIVYRVFTAIEQKRR